jgi:uncharacterized damage-inducible protein DinB
MLPEAQEYLLALQDRRTKIFELLESAPVAAWNWTPTDDETNSLFVLATHVIGSEHGWIYEIVGDGAKTRNRPAEFQAKGESLDALKSEYAHVGQETENVLALLQESDMSTTRYRESHGDVTVRWAILHAIEHMSEHLGQMQLTLQMWEKQIGK